MPGRQRCCDWRDGESGEDFLKKRPEAVGKKFLIVVLGEADDSEI
jgi:hypothetical protein